MTYKIESGKPVPKRVGRKVYPFNDMKPGDSFSVDVSELSREETLAAMRRVISASQSHKRRYDVKFTVRLIPDEKVIRVWRDDK